MTRTGPSQRFQLERPPEVGRTSPTTDREIQDGSFTSQ